MRTSRNRVVCARSKPILIFLQRLINTAFRNARTADFSRRTKPIRDGRKAPRQYGWGEQRNNTSLTARGGPASRNPARTNPIRPGVRTARNVAGRGQGRGGPRVPRAHREARLCPFSARSKPIQDRVATIFQLTTYACNTAALAARERSQFEQGSERRVEGFESQWVVGVGQVEMWGDRRADEANGLVPRRSGWDAAVGLRGLGRLRLPIGSTALASRGGSVYNTMLTLSIHSSRGLP